MPPKGNRHWKKPKYTKIFASGGTVYSYYRRGGHSLRIEGQPGTKAWFDNYRKIHDKWHADKERTGPAPGTLAAAIVAYKKSDRFKALADNTRDRYGYHLTTLAEKLGTSSLSSFTRRTIVQLQAKIATKNQRTSIEVVKVLRQVFENACDLGDIDVNPAKGVRHPAGYKAKQHEAWTDEQIATFLAGAKPVWRRALMVALYTGLRRSDLVRLQRGNIKDGWIVIDIAKTKGHTEIPIHSALRAELEREMRAASLMLIPTYSGKQMTKDSLSHGIRLECLRLGIVPNPPLHGLRRSAIIRLLEAGCSVEEVTSITDQTESMVKYYAGHRHKRVLAESAIVKLEKATRRRKKGTSADKSV